MLEEANRDTSSTIHGRFVRLPMFFYCASFGSVPPPLLHDTWFPVASWQARVHSMSVRLQCKFPAAPFEAMKL
jgi:hypothetical protein